MRWLVVIAVALVLAGCGSTPEAPQPADKLRDTTPEVSVSRSWQHHVSYGQATAGDALPPVLEDGRIHVADQRGWIRARARDKGRREWRMRAEEGVSGGPGIRGDLVVVGTRSGRVMALEAPDGEQRWQARVSSEVLSVPSVGENRVVVRSADGRVYGFDADTGSQRWVHDTSVPSLTLRGTSDPVRAGDYVLVGFDNGVLKALEAASGEAAWEVTLSDPRGSADLDRVRDVDATPVVRDGVVYAVAYRGVLAAVDLGSGEVAWDRELSSHIGLAVDDERVYVSGERGRIWAVDRRTGAAIWRQNDTEGLEASPPTVHGDFIVFGDDTGRLTVLSRQDGRILGRVAVRDDTPISEAPVSDGEAVYVFTDDGHLTRYRLRALDSESDGE